MTLTPSWTYLSPRVLAICEQSLGPQHPNTQLVRRNYADLLRATGRDEEAEQIAPHNDETEEAEQHEEQP